MTINRKLTFTLICILTPLAHVSLLPFKAVGFFFISLISYGFVVWSEKHILKTKPKVAKAGSKFKGPGIPSNSTLYTKATTYIADFFKRVLFFAIACIGGLLIALLLFMKLAFFITHNLGLEISGRGLLGLSFGFTCPAFYSFVVWSEKQVPKKWSNILRPKRDNSKTLIAIKRLFFFSCGLILVIMVSDALGPTNDILGFLTFCVFYGFIVWSEQALYNKHNPTTGTIKSTSSAKRGRTTRTEHQRAKRPRKTSRARYNRLVA